MFYQTEAKPQGWRAVAVFDDRTDRLLYLGRSSTQVRGSFALAYFEVLDDEEREHVKSISLQRWHGAPDAGRWLHQTNLTIPVKAKLAPSARTRGGTGEGPESTPQRASVPGLLVSSGSPHPVRTPRCAGR